MASNFLNDSDEFADYENIDGKLNPINFNKTGQSFHGYLKWLNKSKSYCPNELHSFV